MPCQAQEHSGARDRELHTSHDLGLSSDAPRQLVGAAKRIGLFSDASRQWQGRRRKYPS
jgi:hypothetical protein